MSGEQTGSEVIAQRGRGWVMLAVSVVALVGLASLANGLLWGRGDDGASASDASSTTADATAAPSASTSSTSSTTPDSDSDSGDGGDGGADGGTARSAVGPTEVVPLVGIEWGPLVDYQLAVLSPDTLHVMEPAAERNFRTAVSSTVTVGTLLPPWVSSDGVIFNGMRSVLVRPDGSPPVDLSTLGPGRFAYIDGHLWDETLSRFSIGDDGELAADDLPGYPESAWFFPASADLDPSIGWVPGGGTYRFVPEPRRLSTGFLLTVSSTHALVRECEADTLCAIYSIARDGSGRFRAHDEIAEVDNNPHWEWEDTTLAVLSPGGEWALRGTPTPTELVNIRTGETFDEWLGAERRSISFSPDGRYLVWATDDGTVGWFDLVERTEDEIDLGLDENIVAVALMLTGGEGQQ